MVISRNVRKVLSTWCVHTHVFFLFLSISIIYLVAEAEKAGIESAGGIVDIFQYDLFFLQITVILIMALCNQSRRNPSSRSPHQDVCSSKTQLPYHHPRTLDPLWCLHLWCPHSLRQHVRSMEGSLHSHCLLKKYCFLIFFLTCIFSSGFLGLDWPTLGCRKACRKICRILCFVCWIRWRARIYGDSKSFDSSSPWNTLCSFRL